jgi:uncharacterized membrane protein YfcA
MLDPPILIVVVAIFLIAGMVKGIVGLGLPTIAMALLCLVMPPLDAAALMVVPATVTNIWQMFAGPAFLPLARRLAFLLLGVAAGTFATIGVLARGSGAIASVLLGVVLVAYAIYGLLVARIQVDRKHERVLSPIMGAVAGLLNGATGVFVVPSAPYLASLKMSKDELIQSVGMVAFTAPIALGAALLFAGKYSAANMSFIGLLPAVGGMYIGLRLRNRLNPEVFRRCFLIGLALIGGYMLLR